jgi:hypothetical protein
VFASHHLRVRLWLVSKKAAWQVGDAHKAKFSVSFACDDADRVGGDNA